VDIPLRTSFTRTLEYYIKKDIGSPSDLRIPPYPSVNPANLLPWISRHGRFSYLDYTPSTTHDEPKNISICRNSARRDAHFPKSRNNAYPNRQTVIPRARPETVKPANLPNEQKKKFTTESEIRRKTRISRPHASAFLDTTRVWDIYVSETLHPTEESTALGSIAPGYKDYSCFDERADAGKVGRLEPPLSISYRRRDLRDLRVDIGISHGKVVESGICLVVVLVTWLSVDVDVDGI
jgi:hypothetical protein